MLKAQKHLKEFERLKVLESYSILDTLPEADYDNLTIIAAAICNTPISLVSLLDNNRQWFKSHHGLDASETPRDLAFCAHAINDPSNIFIVHDARQDIRFNDNPLVTGDPNVIFYAGVPLVGPDELPLGTLCVIDNKPNSLSKGQIASLKALSNQVINLLELRRNKLWLEEALSALKQTNVELEKFAYLAAHDLKSPLFNIISLTQLLKDDQTAQVDKEGLDIIELINYSSGKLKNLIQGLLDYSKADHLLKTAKSEVNLQDLIDDIKVFFTYKNNYKINLVADTKFLFTNKSALQQILINLVANAIKYNDKSTAIINISVTENENCYELSIEDNGPGIPKEHHERIFQIFEVIANQDRFGQTGSGIGLAKVKKLVHSLNGTITVDSEVGRGANFIFTIEKSTETQSAFLQHSLQ